MFLTYFTDGTISSETGVINPSHKFLLQPGFRSNEPYSLDRYISCLRRVWCASLRRECKKKV